jgi:flavin-dependent dehydrogenase
MRDLVVAGGGPVGLATALYARRAGLDVLVREPRESPVDKACGEGLMPGALAALAGLGVDPEGQPLSGIRYLDAHRSVDADFAHGPGRGVRRTTLHGSLSRAVAAAGIELEHRPVEAVEQREDHVLVDGEPVRWLIGADGLHSRVRRLVDAERPAAHKRFGLRVHAETAPWTSYVEVHWAPRSEAYVTPVAPDLVGVAVLTDRPGRIEELLDEHPRLRERLAGVTLTTTRGAGPLRQRTTHRVRGRVLLVGDAAGYVDAITGEGIALGLAQARAAVDAIAAGDAAAYERAYRRTGRRHVLLTQALLASSRVPAVRRSIVPLAARLPRVFGAAVDQLARPA